MCVLINRSKPCTDMMGVACNVDVKSNSRRLCRSVHTLPLPERVRLDFHPKKPSFLEKIRSFLLFPRDCLVCHCIISFRIKVSFICSIRSCRFVLKGCMPQYYMVRKYHFLSSFSCCGLVGVNAPVWVYPSV